jgi:hypothetical protein
MTRAFNFGAKLAALTQPEDGVKSAADPRAVKQMATSLVTGLTRTPAQAGQKAMMAARSNLKIKPGATYSGTDFPIRADKSKFLMNPNQSMISRGDVAGLPGKSTHYATKPDILPRRDALSSVGNTAARNQALTQAGVLGGAASLGALSTARQQAPPPEVKARAADQAQGLNTQLSDQARATQGDPLVKNPTTQPVTPMDMFRRATGGYSRLPR